MKKLFTCLVAVLMGALLFAQVPRNTNVKVNFNDLADGSYHKIRLDYTIREYATGRYVKTETWEKTFKGHRTYSADLSVTGSYYIGDIHLQVRCKPSDDGKWRNHDVGTFSTVNNIINVSLGGGKNAVTVTSSNPTFKRGEETETWLTRMTASPAQNVESTVSRPTANNVSRPSSNVSSRNGSTATGTTQNISNSRTESTGASSRVGTLETGSSTSGVRRRNGTTVSSSTPGKRDYSKMERKAGIRAALEDLRGEDSPAALTRRINEEATPPFVISGGDLFELRTEPVNVKEQKSTDLFCNEGTSLFPGCIVYANEALANGNAVPTNDFGYGKVTVTLDIDTGGRVSEVAENSYSGIQAAIRNLVREAYSSGYHQPGRTGYISNDYTSSEQMAIELGCDVSYAGAKLKVSTTTTSKASKMTHFEDLSMIYYTVHVDPYEGDIANLFGPNTTGDDIWKYVKTYKNGPITYVSDMNYGCRVYRFDDYYATEFTFKGSQDASYSGSSVTSKQDIKRNTKASNTRVFVWGGPVTLGTGMIEDSVKVNKVIKDVQSKNGFNISSQNQGLPIGLKTTYAATKTLCARTTTGKYNEISYVKHPKVVSLTCRMEVDGVAGSRVKPKFIYKTMTIDPNYKNPDGTKGRIIQRQINQQPLENNYSGNGTKIKATFTNQLKLGENEYIDGNVYFGVRTKAYSSSDYKQAIEGFVDVVGCGGNVNITVKGDTRSKTYVSGNSEVGLINQTKGK